MPQAGAWGHRRVIRGGQGRRRMPPQPRPTRTRQRCAPDRQRRQEHSPGHFAPTVPPRFSCIDVRSGKAPPGTLPCRSAH